MSQKLKGSSFIILMEKLGQMVTVCCGRDLDITINAELKEATKLPQTVFKSFYYGDLSYSMSGSGVTMVDPGFSVNDFLRMIINRQTLAFVIQHDDESGIFFSGSCLLNSFSVSGSYRDVLQYSFSATGDGALNIGNPYSINILTDGDGNPITDEDGNMIYEQEHGSLLPIDLTVKC